MEPKMIIYFVGKKTFWSGDSQACGTLSMSASGGKVKGKSDDAFETNRALDEIRKKVYDYKQLILSQNRELTVRNHN